MTGKSNCLWKQFSNTLTSRRCFPTFVFSTLCIVASGTNGNTCQSWSSCIKDENVVRRGIRQTGLPFYSIPVKNILRCFRLCEYFPQCVSLNYNFQAELCYLFNMEYKHATFKGHSAFIHMQFIDELKKYTRSRICPATGCPASICISPGEDGTTCQRSIPVPCDLSSGYVYYKTEEMSICIKVHRDKTPWTVAQQTCSSEGSTLFTLKNQKHFDFLNELMSMHNAQGSWHWINGFANGTTYNEHSGKEVQFFPIWTPLPNAGYALAYNVVQRVLFGINSLSNFSFICEADHI